MGAGIAQVAAAAKCQVHLVDLSSDALVKAQNNILASLRRVAKKASDDPKTQSLYVDECMSRIKSTTKSAEAVKNADLVVEAIVEKIETKRQLFQSIDSSAPTSAIFASNTSSLSIRDIAQSSPQRLSQFVGLHFFNPVPQMKLVEIVRLKETTRDVESKLVHFVKALGKTPVLCKDTPG
jgi:3-hydroxyacyl-CoA dehydrogenase